MKSLDINNLIAKLDDIDFDNTNKEIEIKQSFANIISTKYFDNTIMTNFIEETNKELLNLNLVVNRQYSDYSENYSKALALSLTKNNEQINKYNIEAEASINSLQQKIIKEKKVLNQKIVIEQDNNIKNNVENLKIYDEEIRIINKEISERTAASNLVNQRLENEKSIKLAEYEKELEIKISELNTNIESLNNTYNSDLFVLKESIKNDLQVKDDNYLTIKKTHSQSLIKLNSFIDNQKIISKEQLQVNIDKHSELIKSVDEKINEENNLHQVNKEEINAKYLEKTKALNIVFDVQKDVYNNKTSELINKNNIAVTAINKTIRTNREIIEQRIITLEKEKWSKHSKTSSIEEKSSINKEYNKLINKQKNDLLSLGFKNKLELSKQEIIFQTSLFNHDFDHIKQINEWRYSKNLYDLERKEQLEKELSRYNHVINSHEKKKILYNNILSNKQEIVNVYLDKDLLPIESQLFFATSLQNREISLLNLEFESNKLNNQFNQKLLSTKLYLDEHIHRYNLELIKNEYAHKTKTLTIQYQLEIEREILKRNHDVGILKLNLDIQNALLNQKNAKYDEVLNSAIKESSINIELLNHDFLYESKNLRKVASIEKQKRNSIMQEIKIKNQILVIKNKSIRSILLSKNHTESREAINRKYFDISLNIYYQEEKLYKELLSFISIPAHPKKVRSLVAVSLETIDYFKDIVLEILEEFTKIDQIEAKEQLASLSEYKFRVKHEEILNNYNNSLKNINTRKNELTLKENELKEEYNNLENKFKQNLLLVKLYSKNNNGIDPNFNSKDELAAIRNENKSLKSSMDKNLKLRQVIIKDLIPLNESIKKYSDIKDKNELSLNKEINNEQKEYTLLLEKQNKTLLSAKKYLKNHTMSLNKQYNLLIEKPYISDATYSNVKKKFEQIYMNLYKTLVKFNQKLLNFWINTHLIQKNEQTKLIDQFDTSSNLAIAQIKKNYSRFISLDEKETDLLKRTHLENKNKLNINLVNQIKDSKQKIIDIEDGYKKYYNAKELEISESKNSIKSNLELTTINLNDVIANLNSNYQAQLAKSEKTYSKDNLKLDNQIKSINNDLESNISRTNSRTNLIISKHETERKNHLKNMTFKRNKLSSLISKLELKNKSLINDYEFEVNENLKLSKKVQRDLVIEKNKNIIKNKRDRNKLTNKERNSLKKSYKFKSKQIKSEARK